MFKEAVIIIIIFLILFFFLRLLLLKKRRAFQIVSFTLLLGSLILNLFYNLKNLFPEFVLDETVPLGDCSGNLFLYKPDSQYPSQILFPILQDRTVLVDSSSDFYDLFLHTFSGQIQPIKISAQDKAAVLSYRDFFSYQSTLHLVTLMDYAFPDNHILESDPLVYIRTDTLTGADTLIAMIDENLNLYLMSASDFYQITQPDAESGE